MFLPETTWKLYMENARGSTAYESMSDLESVSLGYRMNHFRGSRGLPALGNMESYKYDSCSDE